MRASGIPFRTLPRKVSKGGVIIYGAEEQTAHTEAIPLVSIEYVLPVSPQSDEIIHQWLEVNIYIVSGLLRSLHKYGHHAKPWRKVIDTEIHGPGAMMTAQVSEGIHSIRAQTKPYVPWFLPEF